MTDFASGAGIARRQQRVGVQVRDEQLRVQRLCGGAGAGGGRRGDGVGELRREPHQRDHSRPRSNTSWHVTGEWSAGRTRGVQPVGGGEEWLALARRRHRVDLDAVKRPSRTSADMRNLGPIRPQPADPRRQTERCPSR